MNTIKSLTIKSIKSNKKKSLSTFIGITLSTALIFGIALIFSTIRQNNINKAVIHSGDHHVVFTDVPNTKADIIKNNPRIKSILTQEVLEKVEATKGCSTPNEPTCTIDIISVNENYEENITLFEGNYPKNEKEIIIPVIYKIDGKYKLGEFINDYKIVGTFKTTKFKYNDRYNYNHTNVYTNSNINSELNKTYIVTYKSLNKIYKNIFETARELGLKESASEGLKTTTFENTDINNYYLNKNNKYENLNPELILILCMISIALLLTSIFCVFVIYNAFNISLNEKKKYFGMLRSLGATKKHIIKSVRYEAILLSIFSIPLGILLSILTSKVVIIILNNMLAETLVMPIKLIFNPIYIIMSFIFIIFTIMYSSSIAGDKASAITPINLIRQNSDIYTDVIKDYKFIKKIFGTTGELAYKNIKRNKHKYKITINMLVISFVLFITFGTFTNYLIINWELNLKPDYDAEIYINNKDIEQELISKIQTIDKTFESLFYKRTIIEYKLLEDSKYTKEYLEYKVSNNNNYSFIEVYGFNKEDYNKYINKLPKQNKESVVLFNVDTYHKPLNKDNTKYKKILYSVFKDRVDLELCKVIYNNDDTIRNENCIEEFKNTYIADTPFYNGQDRLGLLLDMDSYKELLNKIKIIDKNSYDTTRLLISTKDYIGFDKDVEEILNQYPSEDISYNSITLDNQNEYSNLKAIRLILFSTVGFITVSGIISVFNIISTNMMLRQREFAMLKSIGLSKKKFNKMINLESIFLGLKTLFFGVIISLIVYVVWIGLYYLMTKEIIVDFPYMYYLIAIISVTLIIFIIMYYSSSKIKNKNIIDTIKN